MLGLIPSSSTGAINYDNSLMTFNRIHFEEIGTAVTYTAQNTLCNTFNKLDFLYTDYAFDIYGGGGLIVNESFDSGTMLGYLRFIDIGTNNIRTSFANGVFEINNHVLHGNDPVFVLPKLVDMSQYADDEAGPNVQITFNGLHNKPTQWGTDETTGNVVYTTAFDIYGNTKLKLINCDNLHAQCVLARANQTLHPLISVSMSRITSGGVDQMMNEESDGYDSVPEYYIDDAGGNSAIVTTSSIPLPLDHTMGRQKKLQLVPYGLTQDIVAVSNSPLFTVPYEMAGYRLARCHVLQGVDMEGTSGTATFMLHRDRGGSVVDMFSSAVSMPAATRSAMATIDGTDHTVAAGDIIRTTVTNSVSPVPHKYLRYQTIWCRG
jgi:hypothetical protein